MVLTRQTRGVELEGYGQVGGAKGIHVENYGIHDATDSTIGNVCSDLK